MGDPCENEARSLSHAAGKAKRRRQWVSRRQRLPAPAASIGAAYGPHPIMRLAFVADRPYLFAMRLEGVSPITRKRASNHAQKPHPITEAASRFRRAYDAPVRPGP